MSQYLCGIVSGLVIALIVVAVWRARDEYQRRESEKWEAFTKIDPPVQSPWREGKLP